MDLSMDPRKQKRLGAAPIASFEKSLEDATAATLNQSSMHQSANKAVKQYMLSNGREMKAENNNAMATKEAVNSSEIATPKDIKQSESQPQTEQLLASGKRAPTLKAAANDGNQQLYKGFSTLATPLTPRIEFSRASSSSTKEEDSRESSPDNVFDQVGTGTLQETIGLGFREDGALELRSSTEELYFMDAAQKKEEQEKLLLQQQQQQQQQLQQQQQAKRSSPHIFKIEEHQMYLQQHQRKDSASSEVAALLCISGRTSRISSVGSQGSAVSRLSAVSGVSRSPSPHRMLLETSFCGPKPLENLVDGRMPSTVEPHMVEQLEQILLRRKQDPTQAVLAEGIKIESSPKKSNTLSNGSTRNKHAEPKSDTNTTKSATMGAQRSSTKSPGQMVVGKTPSGTEYIRINLKPDHMYADKGIAPNERVVDAPNTLTPVYATTQKKPGSLSLGRNKLDENLLTPTASPKLGRHCVSATKELHGSRSPSPAALSVSRKSSFSSLFRFGGGGKDSPDSQNERTRSRSKSKDRQVSQSQNATPNKQKSVLAIFKTNGKRGSTPGIELKSTSKTCSPIDSQQDQNLQNLRSKSQTPVNTGSASTSRPGSRLRYYDEPVEGVIHIPLHTPPEERETRQLLQGIQQLNAEPIRAIPAPITASQLAAAAAALKPVGARKNSNGSLKQTKINQTEKNKMANIDAIHTISQEEVGLDKQKVCSQDSQDTLASESSYAHAIRLGFRSNNQHLPNVKEQDVEAAAMIHRLPSQDSNTSVCEKKIIETVAMVNTCNIPSPVQNINDENLSAKEKRRLLFATRLGSGSQDQVFSTQFSISKTESLTSQLSEKGQDVISESPEIEVLQRQATIIRRPEAECNDSLQNRNKESTEQNFATIKRQGKSGRQTSISTSEDERFTEGTRPTTAPVVLRRKDSSEKQQQQQRNTHSTSEDDATDMANQRHSRYLENFDVRKKYHENVPRKPKRQTQMETINTQDIDPFEVRNSPKSGPNIPQPTPPPLSAPSPSPSTEFRSQSESPVERKQTPTKPPRAHTPTRRSQVNTPTSPSPVQPVSPPVTTIKRSTQSTERQSTQPSTDELLESSESERDFTGLKNSGASDHKRRHHCHVAPIEDHESTGLVSQESFDDELPYIPTTLPEERALGVSIIPMKERANMELKTCPVERPRSTTPLNPSHLEEFGVSTPQEAPYESLSSTPVRGEKLRISLPRKDPNKEKPAPRSPRRSSNASGKSWFEFAEEGLRATNMANLERKDSSKKLLDQKPISAPSVSKSVIVAQKAVTGKSTQRKLSGHWIDFENIPEKRKPPKRITALPKDTANTNSKITQVKQSQKTPDLTTESTHTDGKFHYNYVKPEDCQCECHEHGRGEDSLEQGEINLEGVDVSKVTSVDLLPQGEDLLPLLDTEGHEGFEQSHLSDSSREFSYYTDDEDNIPERRRVSSRRTHTAAKGEFPRREYSHGARSKKFPDNRN